MDGYNYRSTNFGDCGASSNDYRPEADTPSAGGVRHRLVEVEKHSPAGDTLCRQCVGLRPYGDRSPLNRWLTPTAGHVSASGLWDCC